MQTTSQGRAVALTVGAGLLVLAASAGAAWIARARFADQAAAPAAPSSHPPRDGDEGAPAVRPIPRGRLVYQMYCVVCHGAEGHGDGPSAAGLTPPPRDFASREWKFGAAPETVRRVIARGAPGTAMPASGLTLSPGDLDAVTSYVVSLSPLSPLMERAGLTPAEGSRDAPDMDLFDGDGRPSALAGRRGKVVLLVFWETGCVPCLRKLPQLEELADAFRDRGLEVLPVCVNEADAEPVRAVAGRLKSLPLYRDVRGAARLRYGVDAVPAAFLIDRDGRLLGGGTGPADWSGPEARQLLQACLGSPAAK